MKISHRIRAYELIILLHAALLILAIRYLLEFHMAYFGFTIVKTFVAAVAIYLIVIVIIKTAIHAAQRGKQHAINYLRSMFSGASLLNLIRIVAGGVLMVYGYAWLKLFVPLFNQSLYDSTLYAIDNSMHLGINPNRFLIALFSQESVLRILDFEYSLFHKTVLFGFVWFIATPSIRERFKFAGAFCILWLAGSWLYLAVPSLGPCYTLPEDYVESLAKMPLTSAAQDALLHHYSAVRSSRVELRIDRVISVFGVAAFPSLHVAGQALITIWARRRNRFLFLGFLVLSVLTFITSLISGWHYAVDGYAGLLLACIVAWIFERRPRSKLKFKS